MKRNRYFYVNLYFLLLAEIKLSSIYGTSGENKRKEIYRLFKQTRNSWKKYLKIKSFRDLSNKEIEDLEGILKRRIEFLKKLGEENTLN